MGDREGTGFYLGSRTRPADIRNWTLEESASNYKENFMNKIGNFKRYVKIFLKENGNIKEVEVINCIYKICELLESYIITYNIHGQYDDESIIKFKRHIKYLINISKEKYKKYINSYYNSKYSSKYGDLEEVKNEESDKVVSVDNILNVLHSNIDENNGEEYDNIIEYLQSITTEAIPIKYRRIQFLGGGNNKQYKEILGKRRRIYKIKGSRKEHIKYKGELIPVSDYKKLFKKSSKNRLS